MRLPQAGNAIATGRHFECHRLARRLPRAGTSIATGRHFEYPRLALRVPQAGTSSARGLWKFASKGKEKFGRGEPIFLARMFLIYNMCMLRYFLTSKR